MMSVRERLARAIWAVRPDGGKMSRPFPFEDTDVDRRRYNTASFYNGKVAACDLCFEYADAVLKELGWTGWPVRPITAEEFKAQYGVISHRDYCPQCHGPCLRRPRHNDGMNI